MMGRLIYVTCRRYLIKKFFRQFPHYLYFFSAIYAMYRDISIMCIALFSEW